MLNIISLIHLRITLFAETADKIIIYFSSGDPRGLRKQHTCSQTQKDKPQIHIIRRHWLTMDSHYTDYTFPCHPSRGQSNLASLHPSQMNDYKSENDLEPRHWTLTENPRQTQRHPTAASHQNNEINRMQTCVFVILNDFEMILLLTKPEYIWSKMQ